MTIQCDREGVFRADILEYGLREFESGSVAISIRVRFREAWNGEGWDDLTQYEDMEAHGSLFIIKKDGSINNSQVEALVEAAGWDGSMNSIVNATWTPTPCQVVIKAEDYKGQRQYRISFVNPYDRVPGGLSNIDPEKAKALETRFGSSLRAVAGNVKRNAAPAPASKMPAPAKPNGGAWKPPTANEPAPATVPQDSEIPF